MSKLIDGIKNLGQKSIDASRGKKKKSAPAPQPAVLPDEDEEKRNKRRRAALRFGKKGTGRASTILSDQGNGLGG